MKNSLESMRSMVPAQSRAPMQGGPGRDAAADEPLVDLGLLRDLWQFVRHACARRRGTVLAILAAFTVVGMAAATLLPRGYYVETKLLADRNLVMPLLGNPARKLPNESDTPTRLAAELILNHDNLEAIVATADLMNEAERRRPFLSRVKRSIKSLISKPLTPKEQLEELIWTLRTKMNVQVGDGTVTIGTYWSDPNIAFRIVQAAQQSFIEERQAQELALITGSIAILEKSSAEAGNNIASALDSLARERSAMTSPELRPYTGAGRRARPNVELLAAQSNLDATVRSIADLEQYRNRRLAELQSQLTEQRNTYGAAHPQIENTQLMIRGMQTDSPQLAQLRKDEAQWRAEVARLGGGTAAAAAAAATATGIGDQMLAAATLRSMEGMRSDSVIQEKQQYARSRLRIALSSYEALLERLDDARMELQTARATFKFKYGVLVPATVPREPVSINPVFVLVGAIGLGVFMAVFAAVALDLASGRVLEPWQIERSLGLPVLGEASLAQLTR